MKLGQLDSYMEMNKGRTLLYTIKKNSPKMIQRPKMKVKVNKLSEENKSVKGHDVDLGNVYLVMSPRL